jgi:hypothetical protein
MISDCVLKSLAREVRQAVGIERTPSQVADWLMGNVTKPSDSFVLKLLDDRDALLSVANKMRIKVIEDAPPSSEWID